MKNTQLDRTSLPMLACLLALAPLTACSGVEGTEWEEAELGSLEQATQCGAAGEFTDVENYFAPAGIPVETVERTEGAVVHMINAAGEHCTGTLIARNIVLSAGHCGHAIGNQVRFDDQNAAGGGPRQPVIHTITEIIAQKYNVPQAPFPEDTRGDYALLRISGAPASTFGYQRILNEEARTVTNGNQSMAIIGFPAIFPNQPIYETLAIGPFGDTEASQLPNFFGARIDTLGGSSGAAVIRADGQIVGLHTHAGCRPNSTLGNNNMRMPVLFKAIPMLRQIASMQGVSFANVDNVNGVDAIVVNFGQVSVRQSSGTAFTSQANWTAGPYYGTHGTFFADVTGDRKADAIVINGAQIVVRRAVPNAAALTGGTFGPNEIWRDTGGVPTVAAFADVTGDGRADFIDSGSSGSVVFPATAAGVFGQSQLWSGKTGTLATLVGDVTGDARADIIAVNDGNVQVCKAAVGNCNTSTWINNPHYGAYGTFLADVTGDGKGDLIAINGNATIVRRSTGTGFAANETWLSGTHFGSLGMSFADADGDGKADFIAVNPEGVTVRKSNGTTFGAVQTWSGRYFGAL